MPLLPNGAAKLEGASEDPLQVGQQALDFQRTDQDGKTVSLSDFAGRPVILTMTGRYDNTIVINRMIKFKRIADQLQAAGAAVVVISTNYYERNKQLADRVGGVSFPILDDESHAFEAISTYEQPILAAEPGVLLGTDYPIYLLDRNHKIIQSINSEDFFSAENDMGLVDQVKTIGQIKNGKPD